MIEQIAKRLDFPKEAIISLAECEKKIEEKSAQKLSLAEKSIFTPNDNEYLDILAEIAEENQVNKYESDMVFLLRCLEPLHVKYREAGYSDELFYETVSDLKNKLYECKTVYGVWGIFVAFWYKEFLLLNIFGLGRMQYERRTYPFEDREGIVKNGEIAVDKNAEVGLAWSGQNNPRCAIGYVSKGHYLFIVVDGRCDQSPGVSLWELADIFCVTTVSSHSFASDWSTFCPIDICVFNFVSHTINPFLKNGKGIIYPYRKGGNS